MTNLVKNTIIKLDLDGEESFELFLERGWICKYLGLRITKAEVFTTKNGYHVYLHTKNTLPYERILLIESLLGDDYRRVLYNLLRVVMGCTDFDVLFQEKWQLTRLGKVKVSSREEYHPALSEGLEMVLDQELTEKVNVLAVGGEARSV
ncbi:MAG: hypothetical protein GF308_11685 [Candidatus Heimdallarchaeota archaeon]|nr:hypothetical protein [Candidatus Heimdallarchaeota archaeon]